MTRELTEMHALVGGLSVARYNPSTATYVPVDFVQAKLIRYTERYVDMPPILGSQWPPTLVKGPEVTDPNYRPVKKILGTVVLEADAALGKSFLEHELTQQYAFTGIVPIEGTAYVVRLANWNMWMLIEPAVEDDRILLKANISDPEIVLQDTGTPCKDERTEPVQSSIEDRERSALDVEGQ